MASFAVSIVLLYITNPTLSSFDCSNRECCSFQSSTDPSKTNINCNTLSLEKCINTYGYICQWDCTPSNTNTMDTNLQNAGYTIKTYLKISSGDGEYHEPKLSGNTLPISPHGEPHTIEEVIKYTSMTSIDDCGIIYEYTMDEISAANILAQLNDDNEEEPDTNDNSALINRLLRRLTIFNSDGRQDVTGKGSYDYNGYLQFTTAAGKEKRCSGTLIAKDVLITAAHCIHSGVGPWTAEYFSNWRFYPGTDGDSNNMRSREYYATSAYILNEWRSTGVATSSGEYGPNWDYDIGIIFLSSPASQYGWIDFNYNDNLQHGQIFKTVGYPGDKSWLTQWYQQCDWGYVGSEFMATDSCDIYAGSSGSPVFRYGYSSARIRYQNEINCIVSWENEYVNGCARITQSKYYTICQIVNAVSPGSCV
eukprot:85338_1